jgi:hypothetical protein
MEEGFSSYEILAVVRGMEDARSEVIQETCKPKVKWIKVG